MKPCFIYLFLFLFHSHVTAKESNARFEKMIILDDVGVENLRIESEVLEDKAFESTVFAVGEIVDIPSRRSILASRIAGRVQHVHAFEGDYVEKGAVLLDIESRHLSKPASVVSLRAPQSGVVVSSRMRLGEPIEPEDELMEIVDRSELWAVANVPETELAHVKKGSKAYLYMPALGDMSIESHLLRFGTQADSGTSMVKAIFPVKSVQGRLQSGMRVEFSIVTHRREGVWAVSEKAIQGTESNPIVYVKDFELPNAFLPIPVVTGESNGRFVEIIKGLFPGDEVITQGAYALSFAGAGSGMSLKEALDAAHGHEHNEDGSEMTDEQRRAKSKAKVGSEQGPVSNWLMAYAVIVTLLLFYMLAKRQRSEVKQSC